MAEFLGQDIGSLEISVQADLSKFKQELAAYEASLAGGSKAFNIPVGLNTTQFKRDVAAAAKLALDDIGKTAKVVLELSEEKFRSSVETLAAWTKTKFDFKVEPQWDLTKAMAQAEASVQKLEKALDGVKVRPSIDRKSYEADLLALKADLKDAIGASKVQAGGLDTSKAAAEAEALAAKIQNSLSNVDLVIRLNTTFAEKQVNDLLGFTKKRLESPLKITFNSAQINTDLETIEGITSKHFRDMRITFNMGFISASFSRADFSLFKQAIERSIRQAVDTALGKIKGVFASWTPKALLSFEYAAALSKVAQAIAGLASQTIDLGLRISAVDLEAIVKRIKDMLSRTFAIPIAIATGDDEKLKSAIQAILRSPFDLAVQIAQADWIKIGKEALELGKKGIQFVASLDLEKIIGQLGELKTRFANVFKNFNKGEVEEAVSDAVIEAERAVSTKKIPLKGLTAEITNLEFTAKALAEFEAIQNRGLKIMLLPQNKKLAEALSAFSKTAVLRFNLFDVSKPKAQLDKWVTNLKLPKAKLPEFTGLAALRKEIETTVTEALKVGKLEAKLDISKSADQFEAFIAKERTIRLGKIDIAPLREVYGEFKTWVANQILKPKLDDETISRMVKGLDKLVATITKIDAAIAVEKFKDDLSRIVVPLNKVDATGLKEALLKSLRRTMERRYSIAIDYEEVLTKLRRAIVVASAAKITLSKLDAKELTAALIAALNRVAGSYKFIPRVDSDKLTRQLRLAVIAATKEPIQISRIDAAKAKEAFHTALTRAVSAKPIKPVVDENAVYGALERAFREAGKTVQVKLQKFDATRVKEALVTSLERVAERFKLRIHIKDAELTRDARMALMKASMTELPVRVGRIRASFDFTEFKPRWAALTTGLAITPTIRASKVISALMTSIRLAIESLSLKPKININHLKEQWAKFLEYAENRTINPKATFERLIADAEKAKLEIERAEIKLKLDKEALSRSLEKTKQEISNTERAELRVEIDAGRLKAQAEKAAREVEKETGALKYNLQLDLGIFGKISQQVSGLAGAFQSPLAAIGLLKSGLQGIATTAIDVGERVLSTWTNISKGMLGFAASSVKAYAEVESNVQLASALRNLDTKQAAELTDKIEQVGGMNENIFNNTEISAAVLNLARAGEGLEAIKSSIGGIAVTATATGQPIDKLASSFVDIKGKFNISDNAIENQKALDIYTKALTSAKISADNLNRSAQYFSPEKLGVEGFKDFAIQTATYAKVATRGSKVGTDLAAVTRNLSTALKGSTKDAQKKAAVLEKLGLAEEFASEAGQGSQERMIALARTYEKVKAELGNDAAFSTFNDLLGVKGAQAVKNFSSTVQQELGTVNKEFDIAKTVYGKIRDSFNSLGAPGEISKQFAESASKGVSGAFKSIENKFDNFQSKLGRSLAGTFQAAAFAGGKVFEHLTREGSPVFTAFTKLSQRLTGMFSNANPASVRFLDNLSRAFERLMMIGIDYLVGKIEEFVNWISTDQGGDEFVKMIEDIGLAMISMYELVTNTIIVLLKFAISVNSAIVGALNLGSKLSKLGEGGGLKNQVEQASMLSVEMNKAISVAQLYKEITSSDAGKATIGAAANISGGEINPQKTSSAAAQDNVGANSTNSFMQSMAVGLTAITQAWNDFMSNAMPTLAVMFQQLGVALGSVLSVLGTVLAALMRLVTIVIAVAGPPINALLAAVNVGISVIASTINFVYVGISSLFGLVSNAMGQTFAPLFNSLAGWLTNVQTHIQKPITGLTMLFAKVNDFVSELAVTLGKSMGMMLQFANNVISGGFFGILPAAQRTFAEVGRFLGFIGNNTINAFKAIVGTIGPVFAGIGKYVADGFSGLMKILAPVGAAISSIFTGALGGIGKSASQGFGGLAATFSNLTKGAQEFYSAIANNSAVKAAAEFIRKTFGSIGEVFQDIMKISGEFGADMQKIGAEFGKIWGEGGKEIQKSFGELGAEASKLWDEVSKFAALLGKELQPVIADIGKGVQWLLGQVGGFFRAIGSFVAEFTGGLWNGVVETIKTLGGVFAEIWSAGKPLFDFLGGVALEILKAQAAVVGGALYLAFQGLIAVIKVGLYAALYGLKGAFEVFKVAAKIAVEVVKISIGNLKSAIDGIKGAVKLAGDSFGDLGRMVKGELKYDGNDLKLAFAQTFADATGTSDSVNKSIKDGKIDLWGFIENANVQMQANDEKRRKQQEVENKALYQRMGNDANKAWEGAKAAPGRFFDWLSVQYQKTGGDKAIGVAPLEGLIEGLSNAQKKYAAFKDDVFLGIAQTATDIGNGWNSLMDRLGVGIETFKMNWNQFWADIKLGLDQTLLDIQNAWNGFWAGVGAIVNGAIATIQGAWDWLMDAIEMATLTASAAIAQAWNYVGQKFNEVTTFIGNLWNDAMNAISAVVTTMVNTVVGLWNQMMNEIGKFINWLITQFGEAVNRIVKAWNDMVNLIIAVWNQAINTIINAFNGIIQAAIKTAENIQNAFRQALQFVSDQVAKLINFVRSNLSGAFDSAVNAINNMVAPLREAYEWAQKLGSAVANAGSGVGSTVARLAGVAAREKGGPVTANKMYLVGEKGPELIVPRSDAHVLTAKQTSGLMYGGAYAGGTDPKAIAVVAEQSLPAIKADEAEIKSAMFLQEMAQLTRKWLPSIDKRINDAQFGIGKISSKISSGSAVVGSSVQNLGQSVGQSVTNGIAGLSAASTGGSVNFSAPGGGGGGGSLRLGDISGLSASAQKTLKSPGFVQRLEEIAKELGANPVDLLTAMLYESGGSLDPGKVGPYTPDGNAMGLIQFMPYTAKDLGTSSAALSKMTATEQLEYVRKYFKPFAGKIGSYDSLYRTIHGGNPNANLDASDGYRTTREAIADAKKMFSASASKALIRGSSSAINSAAQQGSGQLTLAQKKVMDAARSWIGKEFAPGVQAQCANFVRALFKQAGVAVNQTTKGFDGATYNEQEAGSFFGTDVGQIIQDKSKLQVGDIVVWKKTYGSFGNDITHVGVYSGNGKIIDRSTTGAPVRERSIDTFQDFVAGIRPHSYGVIPGVGSNGVSGMSNPVLAELKLGMPQSITGSSAITGAIQGGAIASLGQVDVQPLPENATPEQIRAYNKSLADQRSQLSAASAVDKANTVAENQILAMERKEILAGLDNQVRQAKAAQAAIKENAEFKRLNDRVKSEQADMESLKKDLAFERDRYNKNTSKTKISQEEFDLEQATKIRKAEESLVRAQDSLKRFTDLQGIQSTVTDLEELKRIQSDYINGLIDENILSQKLQNLGVALDKFGMETSVAAKAMSKLSEIEKIFLGQGKVLGDFPGLVEAFEKYKLKAESSLKNLGQIEGDFLAESGLLKVGAIGVGESYIKGPGKPKETETFVPGTGFKGAPGSPVADWGKTIVDGIPKKEISSIDSNIKALTDSIEKAEIFSGKTPEALAEQDTFTKKIAAEQKLKADSIAAMEGIRDYFKRDASLYPKEDRTSAKEMQDIMARSGYLKLGAKRKDGSIVGRYDKDELPTLAQIEEVIAERLAAGLDKAVDKAVTKAVTSPEMKSAVSANPPSIAVKSPEVKSAVSANPPSFAVTPSPASISSASKAGSIAGSIAKPSAASTAGSIAGSLAKPSAASTAGSIAGSIMSKNFSNFAEGQTAGFKAMEAVLTRNAEAVLSTPVLTADALTPVFSGFVDTQTAGTTATVKAIENLATTIDTNGGIGQTTFPSGTVVTSPSPLSLSTPAGAPSALAATQSPIPSQSADGASGGRLLSTKDLEKAIAAAFGVSQAVVAGKTGSSREIQEALQKSGMRVLGAKGLDGKVVKPGAKNELPTLAKIDAALKAAVAGGSIVPTNSAVPTGGTINQVPGAADLAKKYGIDPKFLKGVDLTNALAIQQALQKAGKVAMGGKTRDGKIVKRGDKNELPTLADIQKALGAGQVAMNQIVATGGLDSKTGASYSAEQLAKMFGLDPKFLAGVDLKNALAVQQALQKAGKVAMGGKNKEGRIIKRGDAQELPTLAELEKILADGYKAIAETPSTVASRNLKNLPAIAAQAFLSYGIDPSQLEGVDLKNPQAIQDVFKKLGFVDAGSRNAKGILIGKGDFGELPTLTEIENALQAAEKAIASRPASTGKSTPIVGIAAQMAKQYGVDQKVLNGVDLANPRAIQEALQKAGKVAMGGKNKAGKIVKRGDKDELPTLVDIQKSIQAGQGAMVFGGTGTPTTMLAQVAKSLNIDPKFLAGVDLKNPLAVQTAMQKAGRVAMGGKNKAGKIVKRGDKDELPTLVDIQKAIKAGEAAVSVSTTQPTSFNMVADVARRFGVDPKVLAGVDLKDARAVQAALQKAGKVAMGGKNKAGKIVKRGDRDELPTLVEIQGAIKAGEAALAAAQASAENAPSALNPSIDLVAKALRVDPKLLAGVNLSNPQAIKAALQQSGMLLVGTKKADGSFVKMGDVDRLPTISEITAAINQATTGITKDPIDAIGPGIMRSQVAKMLGIDPKFLVGVDLSKPAEIEKAMKNAGLMAKGTIRADGTTVTVGDADIIDMEKAKKAIADAQKLGDDEVKRQKAVFKALNEQSVARSLGIDPKLLAGVDLNKPAEIEKAMRASGLLNVGDMRADATIVKAGDKDAMDPKAIAASVERGKKAAADEFKKQESLMPELMKASIAKSLGVSPSYLDGANLNLQADVERALKESGKLAVGDKRKDDTLVKAGDKDAIDPTKISKAIDEAQKAGAAEVRRQIDVYDSTMKSSVAKYLGIDQKYLDGRDLTKPAEIEAAMKAAGKFNTGDLRPDKTKVEAGDKDFIDKKKIENAIAEAQKAAEAEAAKKPAEKPRTFENGPKVITAEKLGLKYDGAKSGSGDGGPIGKQISERLDQMRSRTNASVRATGPLAPNSQNNLAPAKKTFEFKFEGDGDTVSRDEVESKLKSLETTLNGDEFLAIAVDAVMRALKNGRGRMTTGLL